MLVIKQYLIFGPLKTTILRQIWPINCGPKYRAQLRMSKIFPAKRSCKLHEDTFSANQATIFQLSLHTSCTPSPHRQPLALPPSFLFHASNIFLVIISFVPWVNKTTPLPLHNNQPRPSAKSLLLLSKATRRTIALR